MKKFTLLFASVAVLYACNKTNVLESPAVFSEAEIARMNEVNDKILARFNVLAKESPEKNIIFSPLSISTLIGMTNNYKESESEKLKNENVLYNKLIRNHKDATVGKLSNAVFFNTEKTWDSGFENILSETYRADVFKMNFNDKYKVKAKIEDWVSQKTESSITNIGVDISKDEELKIVNAMYFKGLWIKDTFKKKYTKSNIFYNYDGGKPTISFMNTSRLLKYYSDDSFSAVIVPFSNDYSMTFILPSSDEKDFSLDNNKFRSILKSVKWGNISLKVPKFTSEYSDELILSNFGGKGTAKHIAYISIDEDGATASAISISNDIALEPINIVVNRPFFYVIADKAGSQIVEIGRIAKL